MITENVATLKINKLTKAQYDRELAAGNIDPNALYLTPDTTDADKAPAGYGLGTTAKQLSNCDLNDITENGWYSYVTGAGITNSPKDYASTLFVETYHTGDRGKQTVTLMDGNNTTIVRAFYDGSWGEWEYINPPMTTGIEFRTTERYNGKPIYAKLVYCGYLPNNGRKMVDSGISKSTAKIIKCSQSRILTSSNGCVGDCDSAAVVHVDAITDSDNFQIIMDTCADVTADYEVVELKYVYE